MWRADSLEKTLMLGKMKAGEGDDRGWDGWMASPTQWTWIWASSGRWWRIGRPGVLQSMGSQRVGHNWVTEQQQQAMETLQTKSIQAKTQSTFAQSFKAQSSPAQAAEDRVTIHQELPRTAPAYACCPGILPLLASLLDFPFLIKLLLIVSWKWVTLVGLYLSFLVLLTSLLEACKTHA